MKTLNLGDVVYKISFSLITNKEKIVRLTNTTAITNLNTKLKLNITDNGYCHQIAAGKYNNSSYFIETLELRNSFLKQQLVNKISKFNFNKIDIDSLIKINEIIETKLV